MGQSQFQIYTGNDTGGPGLITGTVGSLLTILDTCLVGTDGIAYGSKPSAGWTKPIANSNNIGCYTQGSGSMHTILVNDNGAGTALAKEVFITGWESITSVASPVGTGYNQFPTPAQSLTTGCLMMRKSNTADATGRYWRLYADSSTFYLFIASGDIGVGYYTCMMFGDLYSLAGSGDKSRCLIIGYPFQVYQTVAASGVPTGQHFFDIMTLGYQGNLAGYAGSVIHWMYINFCYPVPGHYISRTYTGVGNSINVAKFGDASVGTAFRSQISTSAYMCSGVAYAGRFQTPNGPDATYYLSPIFIAEPTVPIGAQTNIMLRGRWRGMYQVCHPSTNFADGQIFAGGGDYAGKTFQIVKLCGEFGGYFAIEISDTVDTNDP